MRTYPWDGSVPLSLRSLHPSSSSKRRTDRFQPVQDYRYLNSITVKNKYLLPLVDDLVQHLKGARYFTKLDVRWGYNNVRIREGDRVEGHVPDEPGHVRAIGDVLWTHEQPSDLPDNDERHLRGSDSGRPCMHLHGRYPCFRSNPDGTSSDNVPGFGAALSAQAVPQSREV